MTSPASMALPADQHALEAVSDSADQTASSPASQDILISRARPLFLYVMYAIILWSLPVGLVAAVSPATAAAVAKGTGDYLACLPEPLYALFGTGYLGYATLRQWGKIQEGKARGVQ